MRLVNQVLAVLAQSAPNIGMIAGMFSGVPETYSLAILLVPHQKRMRWR